MFEVEPFSGEDGAFFRGETDPELNVSAVVNRAVALAGNDGDDLARAVASDTAPVRPAMRTPASLVAQPFSNSPGTSESHRITAQDLAGVARTPPPEAEETAPARPAAAPPRLSHLPGATLPRKPER